MACAETNNSAKILVVDDGYETLAALRSDPASRNLPVLIISARGEAHAVKRALDAGANGYFVKPFETRDLVAEIRRLLSARTPAS